MGFWNKICKKFKTKLIHREEVKKEEESCRLINRELEKSAMDGNLEMLNDLIKKCIDLEARTDSGMSALMLAAWSGHIDYVKVLIDQGVDINGETRDEYTALRSAVNEGYVEIAELLIASGARVDENIENLLKTARKSPNKVVKNVSKKASGGVENSLEEKKVKSKTLDINNNTNISSVMFFCEPPYGFPPENFVTSGLPKGFIEEADLKLKLNGRLVLFVNNNQENLQLRNISWMEDSECNHFYSRLSRNGFWRLYYGIGASNARYSVMVDFIELENSSGSVVTRSEKSRKEIYSEFSTAWNKHTVRCVMRTSLTDEETTTASLNAAANEIMNKHGLSREEMKKIINEGAEKWHALRNL